VIAEENRLMMMDLREMDALAREFREMKKLRLCNGEVKSLVVPWPSSSGAIMAGGGDGPWVDSGGEDGLGHGLGKNGVA
jgi:hypothetical protein